MKAYSIVMTEKQQALSAMVVAVGAVYGPKIGALMVINSMRRNPAVIVPQPQPATDAPAMRMQ
jgi:DNA integrity scanning protein DisA with diadenylate cyclase activity